MSLHSLHPLRAASGFTLVELIVVIILVGILAAVAVPRWRGDTGFEARGLRDETAAALRYAQKSAVAARRQVCVSFTADSLSFTADSLSARMDASFEATNACTEVLPGPDGRPLSVKGSGGAAYAGTPSGVVFDPRGRPNARAEIGVTGLPATLAIVVEAETGYVH